MGSEMCIRDSPFVEYFRDLLIGRDPTETRQIAEDLGEKHIKYWVLVELTHKF